MIMNFEKETKQAAVALILTILFGCSPKIIINPLDNSKKSRIQLYYEPFALSLVTL